MSEIEVDPDGLRARSAALYDVSQALYGIRIRLQPPDCGDRLAESAVAAMLEAVDRALSDLAVELTRGAAAVGRAAATYELVDNGVVHD